MSLTSLVRAVRNDMTSTLTRRILSLRVRSRFPGLWSDPTTIWDVGFHDLDAIEIGRNVRVLARCEMLVYARSRHSTVAGRLILGDDSFISTGCNVRAAGGTIRIGRNSCLSQHCVAVAANHMLIPGTAYLRTPWDIERTGVEIGDNVWVAANCVLLPGSRIGSNAVIAAGSVVRGDVPAGEIWGGVPARFIRRVSSD